MRGSASVPLRGGLVTGMAWQPLPVLTCQVSSAEGRFWEVVPVVTRRFLTKWRQMADTTLQEQQRRSASRRARLVNGVAAPPCARLSGMLCSGDVPGGVFL
jgi:hypothetical protein